jgi:mRNA-degrading endonuclease RelE of RelBE toxin-antitoxin system
MRIEITRYFAKETKRLSKKHASLRDDLATFIFNQKASTIR